MSEKKCKINILDILKQLYTTISIKIKNVNYNQNIMLYTKLTLKTLLLN